MTRWASQQELQFRRLEAEDLKKGQLHYGDCGINLLKLHGSLDFFVYDDRKCYLGLAPDDTGAVRVEALAELAKK